WQVGGIWTLQSGFPVTPTSGSDRSGAGAGFDRPDATGKTPYQGNQTPNRWWPAVFLPDGKTPNPDSAFTNNVPGTFGNAGRNSLRGPKYSTLDFSAHKEFRMFYKDTHQLQFRLEAFNVLNHPVWGIPTANVASTGFGIITGTAVSMRQ